MGTKTCLKITRDDLFLNDELFYLASGSMHYFRIHPTAWRERLNLMVSFGLTAVQTYVPWNLHEPREGCFCFKGLLDLATFLREVDGTGLKVLLRPSPFINSEFDLGGLPWWLLKRPDIELRSSDSTYLECVAAYYKRLCQEFVPMLSTNGGPIIAIALENEYGGWAYDPSYLAFLRDCLVENGVDIPFYTTDCNRSFFFSGTLPDVWTGVNYRIESTEAIAALKDFQPDKPPLVGEYWSGRAGYWGTPFHARDPKPIAEAYRNALDQGAFVNFYMFCGGTNFGFSSGSKVLRPFDAQPEDPERFYAITTSYDVNALIGEDGRPTEKYFACRRELAVFQGRPLYSLDEDLPHNKAQMPGTVILNEYAALFENLNYLSSPVISHTVKTMEQLDQGYGFILYVTDISGAVAGSYPLFIDGLGDRAVIYANGLCLGVYMRGYETLPIQLQIPPNGLRLEILVENCGRLSTGHEINKERKGIRGGVRLGGMQIYGWTMFPLPMDHPEKLLFRQATPPAINTPVFCRGFFDAIPLVDTFLRTDGWTKGLVWINGFLLGRYWEIGPQYTLYVPGGLLREKYNEVILFEIHRTDPSQRIVFSDSAELDGPLKPLHIGAFQ